MPEIETKTPTWTDDELEDLYAAHAKNLGLSVFPRPDGERYLQSIERRVDHDDERGYVYPTVCKKNEFDYEDVWFFPQLFGTLPSPGDVKVLKEDLEEPDTEQASVDLTDDEIAMILAALTAAANDHTLPSGDVVRLTEKLGFKVEDADVRLQAAYEEIDEQINADMRAGILSLQEAVSLQDERRQQARREIFGGGE